MLQRLDPAAAQLIHANDAPKLIRSLEVTLTARALRKQRNGKMPAAKRLTGYNVLRLGLAPDRKAQLYARIDARAAAMFERGLARRNRHAP